MPRPIPACLAAALTAGLVACAAAGGTGSLRPAPPAAPLDSLPLASDVRLDSAGYLAGSFVGEGTSRRIHLLSSDTALVEALARRFRPDLTRGELGLWEALRRAGEVPLSPPERRRTVAGRGPRVMLAMVGSPLGHTEITLSEVLLRGSPCGRGARGASVELIVETDPSADDPPLRGPVLGTFLVTGAARRRDGGLVRRPDSPEPSPALVRRLIERTASALDSAIAARYPGLELQPLASERIEVNTLADLDAADVAPFRTGGGALRYAVSLRQRRLTAAGDTVVATAVTAWDGDGERRQEIFHPTLLSSAGGRLGAFGPEARAVYWRRLQPISDIAYRRDNIWMEQVDVREGRVVWGIIQPDENVVVAAAEVDGGCG